MLPFVCRAVSLLNLLTNPVTRILLILLILLPKMEKSSAESAAMPVASIKLESLDKVL